MICGGGTILCNGACKDPNIDFNNCGMCGVVCGMGGGCAAGKCTCPGAMGLACNGVCTDAAVDVNNCGKCGTVCALKKCVSGVCATVSALAKGGTGFNHSAALMSDATVQIWGYNSDGQLGDNTLVNATRPKVVPGLNAVAQVVTGGYFTCARLVAGTIKCWGDNIYGGLGDNSITDRLVPTDVQAVGGGGTLSNVVEIAAGAYFACARINDGTVKCWGDNLYGQIGDGSTTDRRLPTAVLNVANAVELSAGIYHACARLMDNTVKCWGYNTYGQLGDNSTTSRSTPVVALNVTNTTQITCGSNHTCVLLNGGTAQCWGVNSNGGLGDGTTNQRNTAAYVLVAPGGAQLSGVAEITAGYYNTCARMNDNSARCWGYNVDGELADGTTTNRLSPCERAGDAGRRQPRRHQPAHQWQVPPLRHCQRRRDGVGLQPLRRARRRHHHPPAVPGGHAVLIPFPHVVVDGVVTSTITINDHVIVRSHQRTSTRRKARWVVMGRGGIVGASGEGEGEL